MRNTRVVLSALGGPEVFKIIEDEIRDPGPKELRILVLASGVSYADVLMRH
jgi:NADPH:quinone reductase-like Zn-dependent oxidoreductase